ncbi:hypothetical protein [Streptomyces canus]
MTHTVVWENAAMNEFRRLRAIDPVGAKEPDGETVTIHVLKVGRST